MCFADSGEDAIVDDDAVLVQHQAVTSGSGFQVQDIVQVNAM